MKYATLVLLVIASTASVIAGNETRITGSVVGYDGKPLRLGHVHLARSVAAGPIQSVTVDSTGAFELRTTEHGLFKLQFSGVGHATLSETVACMGGEEIEVEARLAVADLPERFDTLYAIGDFNDFVQAEGVLMRSRPDGSFRVTLPARADTLAYQLVYYHKQEGGFRYPQSMHGTLADYYVFDGRDAYRSVLKSTGDSAAITFNPAHLLRSDAKAHARFRNPHVDRFAEVFRAMARRRDSMMQEFREFQKIGNWEKPFTMDWSATKAALQHAIDTTQDELLREALILAQLDLNSLGMAEADPAVAIMALEEIPPTSIVWSHQPMLMNTAMRATGEAEMYGGYQEVAMADHPDPDLRSSLLFTALMEAANPNGSEADQRRYYTMLVEGHPESTYARMARNQFDPDRKIVAGKQVPEFSFTSLDKPAKTYTREAMLGKYYLLDFWATWCKPCLEQMEVLHSIHDKFKDKDFEIISLSFDNQSSDVLKFRRKKWKMPWAHSLVEGGLNNEIARRFEVQGIPKPILVNPQGTIVAVGDDLKGPFLEMVIQRYLDPPDFDAMNGGE